MKDWKRAGTASQDGNSPTVTGSTGTLNQTLASRRSENNGFLCRGDAPIATPLERHGTRSKQRGFDDPLRSVGQSYPSSLGHMINPLDSIYSPFGPTRTITSVSHPG